MSHAEPVPIALYSDIHCPYAYLTVFRLRKILPAYEGRVEIAFKCLALEYVNAQPTPKPALDIEAPILMLEEPAIPYAPWHAPASEWPVTMWPAFEAIKCAARQGAAFAAELDWAIRVAFFAESRCVSMRHVLLELAEGAGLDMPRFAADFDGGVAKGLVIEEARDGWERLRVAGSPTLVLASGERRGGQALGLPEVKLDETRHHRVTAVVPAPCSGQACLDLLREVIEEAVRG